MLITFVPCSARSAIILALAGKYLGGSGVFAIFALTIVVVALMGRLLARNRREFGPGQVQEIPPYALPLALDAVRNLGADRGHTHHRHAAPGRRQRGAGLLHHVGAMRRSILFTPVTSWWLGLPVVLGGAHPVRRPEEGVVAADDLSGARDVRGRHPARLGADHHLPVVLTFYIPCISTFAVMLKTIGRKDALVSVSLSVGVALLVSGVVRLLLGQGACFRQRTLRNGRLPRASCHDVSKFESARLPRGANAALAGGDYAGAQLAGHAR